LKKKGDRNISPHGRRSGSRVHKSKKDYDRAEQKRLIIGIMQADEKDGLYDDCVADMRDYGTHNIGEKDWD
jgi:hypothetical protein